MAPSLGFKNCIVRYETFSEGLHDGAEVLVAASCKWSSARLAIQTPDPWTIADKHQHSTPLYVEEPSRIVPSYMRISTCRNRISYVPVKS